MYFINGRCRIHWVYFALNYMKRIETTVITNKVFPNQKDVFWRYSISFGLLGLSPWTWNEMDTLVGKASFLSQLVPMFAEMILVIGLFPSSTGVSYGVQTTVPLHCHQPFVNNPQGLFQKRTLSFSSESVYSRCPNHQSVMEQVRTRKTADTIVVSYVGFWMAPGNVLL